MYNISQSLKLTDSSISRVNFGCECVWLYRRKLDLRNVLLKYGRFLLKHSGYSCVITQTVIQKLLNAWPRVVTMPFHGGYLVENVTREWLLPSNEIFPCQSPICEFSISIRLSSG